MNQPIAANLERRIKRQWGAEHDFFAVCQPGLERLCAEEMAGLGIEPTAMEHGGLSFSGRLDLVYRLHLHSRLLSRVLLRLKDFRIRNLADFSRKLSALAWEVFLPPGARLKIHSDLGHSHLQHGPTLESHLLRAITERLQSFGLVLPTADDKADIRILLRTQQGRCTVSLDLTGQHLHKRGYRKQPGRAPLRETLAAAFLHYCQYDGSCQLLDPMCGSGTIALEAAQIALKLAPGRAREFVINRLPCHRPATWRHMLKQAQDEAANSLAMPVIARDKASLNLARINAGDLAQYITWQQADFWQVPAPIPPGLMLMNPPYGVRLGSVRQGAALSKQLGKHIKSNYAGWRIGILLYRPEWARHFKLADSKSLVLSHGGLKLTMLCGLQL